MSQRCTALAWVAFVICGVVGIGGTAWGANGDIDFQLTHTCGTAAIDMCYDTTDDSLFVMDEFSGEICHYGLSALPPDIVFIASFTHPSGAASGFPPSPRMGGIAYDSVADTLFLLQLTPSIEIQQTDKTGVAIGGPIAVETLADGSPRGLTYDSVTGHLWYLDVNNETLVRIDPATGLIQSTVAVPSNVPNESLFGAGLDFVLDGGSFMEITFGETLSFALDRSIRLDLSTGLRVGTEVDLTQIPEEVRGYVRAPAGTPIIYACTGTELYKIDAIQPALAPATNLTCFSELNGSVNLNWINNGPYDTISIVRNGDPVNFIAGTATSYVDAAAPLNTVVTYEVHVFSGPEESITTCTVNTGAGALLDYTPFDGGRVFDLALDEATNTLFASDNLNGEILMYNADDMTFLGSTPVPGLTLITGIAWNPNPVLAPHNLIVAEAGNALLTSFDPIGGTIAASTFPAGPPGVEVGGMTYNSLLDAYQYVERNTNQICTIEADPNQGPGTLLGCCDPPVVTSVNFDDGLTVLETGTLLATVETQATAEPAGMQQFDNGNPICPQTSRPLNVPTDNIGASETAPDGVLGIEAGGNIAYVAGGAANTIFRVLLAASGDVFVRGDANSSGGLPDLADAIFIADYLFTAAGATPTCLDAADTNDDGMLDISDPLYLIFYLFLGGTEPPEPFPNPGVDPTFFDPLSC